MPWQGKITEEEVRQRSLLLSFPQMPPIPKTDVITSTCSIATAATMLWNAFIFPPALTETISHTEIKQVSNGDDKAAKYSVLTVSIVYPSRLFICISLE